MDIISFFYIVWDFKRKQLCHLRIKHSLFPFQYEFLLFPFLVALSRNSTTRLNTSGESRHLLLSMMLSMDFLQVLFTRLGKCLSISVLLKLFIVNKCWISLNFFLYLSRLSYASCFLGCWSTWIFKHQTNLAFLMDLVMMDYHFYIVLDAIYYFLKGSCFYICERYWSVVFL